MKLFKKMKDGGPNSNVTGYWLIELKSLFSIVVLKFENGSRDNFHSHAFNSISWLINGIILEEHITKETNWIKPSMLPFITSKECFHKVFSYGTSWALSFRGPWDTRWKEYDPNSNKIIELKNGRIETGRYKYSYKK